MSKEKPQVGDVWEANPAHKLKVVYIGKIELCFEDEHGYLGRAYVDKFMEYCKLVERGQPIDNRLYNKGNNSEYEYWIAGVSEKPETTPKGVEAFDGYEWSKSDKRVYNWGICNRRWPKKQGLGK